MGGRRSKLRCGILILCAHLALVACSSTPREDVYVTLRQIPAPIQTSAPRLSGRAATSFASKPRTVPFALGPTPELPPIRIRREGLSLSGLNQEGRDAQADLLKKLQEQLQAAYAREAERFALQERRRFGFPERKGADAVMADLRASFDKLVKKQLPSTLQVALRVGWPDLEPTGFDQAPADASDFVKLRQSELVALRQAIQSHEKVWAKEVAALLAKAKDLAEKERATLNSQLQAYASEMNERALREALDPLAEPRKPIRFLVTDRYSVDVPRVPGLVAPEFPAVEKPPEMVNSPDARQPGPTWNTIVRKQLDIWLAVKNYRLVSAKLGGRDATKEFSEWIRAHAVGP